MSQHRIGDRLVGNGSPPLLIGEVGQAHDGSLGTAHAFVDALADAGVDAVKFQTHIAAAESTVDEPFRVEFSKQDATRYDYWQRMEFTEEQWRGLAQHAAARGVLFLSSAFSVEAVRLLERVGVPAWKVGSGEFRSWDLIDAMTTTGKPVILSTGMSTFGEIQEAVDRIRNAGSDVFLLQCTSRYPADFEHVGLNVIDALRTRFGCPVGLSDHSGSLWPAVAAMARGAHLIEAHVAFDRRMFGPDVPASLEIDEFALLVEARDAIATMLAHPIDKDAMAAELAPMRALFTKSLAPARSLPAGTVLAADMLTAKKPGTGITPDEVGSVVGRRLRRDVAPDRLLRTEDLDA